MAGRIIKEVTQTIGGAASTGVITVTTTAGFYQNAYGYLYKSGQVGAVVKILDILSSTQLKVKQIKDPRGGGVGTTGVAADAGYGAFDASAYNGGAITLPTQVVMNPNDLPLS